MEENNKKKRTYFTRRNLIAISVSIFYALIFIFTGLCLSAGEKTLVAAGNPIALFAQSLGMKTILLEGVNGYVTLCLVAFYIIVCTVAIVYEGRFAIVNNIKVYSFKMIMTYLITIFISIALSLGLGILIQLSISLKDLGDLTLFISQTLAISLMIFAFLALIVIAILMFVFNIILIDKPYKFFDEDDMADLGEIEEDGDVTANFDVSGTVNGAQSVQGAPVESQGVSPVEGNRELDDREKVFPSLSRIDIEYEGYINEKVETDNYSLEEICHLFRNWLAKEEKLYYEIDTLRIFIAGLAASHFSILEGLSGTGKSSLPRYFAKFVNGKVHFFPVQATWRDKTSILGYFNDFSATYNETDFLVNLYEANFNPDVITMFVLDEMNISRVEYYFADFLSVLEYPVNEWKLRVMHFPYDFVPPIKLEEGFIQIPENAYFVGTANKDDSTFAIADKVYDRAITLFFDNKNVPFEVKEEVSTIHLSASKLRSLYREALENQEYLLTEEDLEKFLKICDYIYDTFEVTFGNRILNQMQVLVPIFIACGGEKENALDFLLSRKLLAKLEGRFEEYVKSGLKRLVELINKTYGEKYFKDSRRLINSYIKKL